MKSKNSLYIVLICFIIFQISFCQSGRSLTYFQTECRTTSINDLGCVGDCKTFVDNFDLKAQVPECKTFYDKLESTNSQNDMPGYLVSLYRVCLDGAYKKAWSFPAYEVYKRESACITTKEPANKPQGYDNAISDNHLQTCYGQCYTKHSCDNQCQINIQQLITASANCGTASLAKTADQKSNWTQAGYFGTISGTIFVDECSAQILAQVFPSQANYNLESTILCQANCASFQLKSTGYQYTLRSQKPDDNSIPNPNKPSYTGADTPQSADFAKVSEFDDCHTECFKNCDFWCDADYKALYNEFYCQNYEGQKQQDWKDKKTQKNYVSYDTTKLFDKCLTDNMQNFATGTSAYQALQCKQQCVSKILLRQQTDTTGKTLINYDVINQNKLYNKNKCKDVNCYQEVFDCIDTCAKSQCKDLSCLTQTNQRTDLKLYMIDQCKEFRESLEKVITKGYNNEDPVPFNILQPLAGCANALKIVSESERLVKLYSCTEECANTETLSGDRLYFKITLIMLIAMFILL